MAGGKGDSKDAKRGHTQWDEKESRRAEISKRRKPTLSGEPRRDGNPGSNPGDTGRWAKRANLLQAWGHIEDRGASSPAVTPCIRQGGAPRRVETFGGEPLGGHTDCFLPALQSHAGAGRRERGDGAQGEDGWFWAMKCCRMGSEPPAQPSRSLLVDQRAEEHRARVFPLLLPARLPAPLTTWAYPTQCPLLKPGSGPRTG